MKLDLPVPTPIVPAITQPLAREIATFGAVHLDVTDIARSTSFWTDLIGLTVRLRTANVVELGTELETLVVLHAGAHTKFLHGHSGLYHLAIHPPTQADFAVILLRLVQAGWRFSPTDHIMSKAIYLLDPDGITVEITLETPRRLRELVIRDNGVQAIRADGSVASGRDPFDVESVLALLPASGAADKAPLGTRIGHVHLHVGDLLAAYQFYRSLGFRQAMWAPQVGVGDLGAGGEFNHRIAVNTWQGENVPQSPPGSARMRHFSIRFDTDDLLRQALRDVPGGFTEVDNGFAVRDPSGNTAILSA